MVLHICFWLVRVSTVRYFPYTSHCNTLRHIAIHSNTIADGIANAIANQFAFGWCGFLRRGTSYIHYTTTRCNALQHTATHCNTLQHTATHVLMALQIALPINLQIKLQINLQIKLQTKWQMKWLLILVSFWLFLCDWVATL